jgi:hypothetical protein
MDFQMNVVFLKANDHRSKSIVFEVKQQKKRKKEIAKACKKMLFGASVS